MEIMLAILRYGLVTAAVVEVVLIGRALVTLAVEKAKSPAVVAATTEE
ncbi:hypothetical protein [Candidatus Oscillochloris fontis]|nr:hypothetical protein [Candidatus Oscillochloris fontis]